MSLPAIAAFLAEIPAPTWHGLSADNWIKVVAVAVGAAWTAAWTVINVVKGRTYRKRLEVDMPGVFSEK